MLEITNKEIDENIELITMLQQKSSLMLIVESFQEIAWKLCETLSLRAKRY